MTCSISSFTPVPNQAVYSASKAYVQYLSRALHEEVRKRGIRILMMCPGNMDTEMNPKGQGRQSSRINMLPFLDMNVITEKSLEMAERGKAVYTPGIFYKFYKVSSKLLPQATAFMWQKALRFWVRSSSPSQKRKKRSGISCR